MARAGGRCPSGGQAGSPGPAGRAPRGGSEDVGRGRGLEGRAAALEGGEDAEVVLLHLGEVRAALVLQLVPRVHLQPPAAALALQPWGGGAREGGGATMQPGGAISASSGMMVHP